MIKHDPITLEIIQNSLRAISDEMFYTIAKTAMSPIIYELLDMAFPDIDDFELFRGLGHRDVSKELENLAQE